MDEVEGVGRGDVERGDAGHPLRGGEFLRGGDERRYVAAAVTAPAVDEEMALIAAAGAQQ